MNVKNSIRALTPRRLRNWLRNPRVSLKYIVDRAAFTLGRTAEVDIRPGWRVRCHPASKHHFAIFVNDHSQSEELDDFRNYCRPQMQLLDVGAHYGFFALAALHFADARIVCVEASTQAAAILKTNLKLNHAGSKVQVVEAAMGNSDGYLEMLSTGPHGSDYFVIPRQKRSDTTRIRQVTLPAVVAQSGLQPTHVKIDVEGFEAEVLEGGYEFLKKHRPTLFLELHGSYLSERGINPASIIKTLQDIGYQRFEQNGRILELNEIAASGFNARFVCLN